MVDKLVNAFGPSVVSTIYDRLSEVSPEEAAKRRGRLERKKEKMHRQKGEKDRLDLPGFRLALLHEPARAPDPGTPLCRAGPPLRPLQARKVPSTEETADPLRLLRPCDICLGLPRVEPPPLRRLHRALPGGRGARRHQDGLRPGSAREPPGRAPGLRLCDLQGPCRRVAEAAWTSSRSRAGRIDEVSRRISEDFASSSPRILESPSPVPFAYSVGGAESIDSGLRGARHPARRGRGRDGAGGTSSPTSRATRPVSTPP